MVEGRLLDLRRRDLNLQAVPYLSATINVRTSDPASAIKTSMKLLREAICLYDPLHYAIKGLGGFYEPAVLAGEGVLYLTSTWSARASFAIVLAERKMDVLEPFLSRLARSDQADLEYVAEHLAWQQEAFDRRHGLAGPVEKIGNVPFVIAAVTSAPQVFNALRNVGPNAGTVGRLLVLRKKTPRPGGIGAQKILREYRGNCDTGTG
jgi:hypothetical protein